MAQSRQQKIELLKLLNEKERRSARNNLLNFTKYTFDNFHVEPFHKVYYNILDKFADKKIKNLIISMPPQHGKSEGSSIRTPAYIIGKRQNDKIGLVSFSASKAKKFGRSIINLTREKEYIELFPDVRYPERGYTGAKSNTGSEKESINSNGSMKFVGISGGLTGDPVDVLIMDDLYKDWKEASSPISRQTVWDWHLTVAETRLHNNSQQLIVFTRWSDDDLVGRLEALGKVVELDFNDDIDSVISTLKHDEFIKINFPALQNKDPSKLDQRKKGEALWSGRHSKQKLESSRAKDPNKFNCLHQGEPQNKEGLLYKDFKTYSELPPLKKIGNYTDTADTGKDYLCSMVYGKPLSSIDKHIYILDVLYSQDSMEITEQETIDLLNRNEVNESDIESNNGGRGFARVIQKGVKTVIKWFHQGKNKEARIFSNSATVNNTLVFPKDWHIKWPDLYDHITKYKKLFTANEFDDAPDTMTGIIEKNIIESDEFDPE